MKTFVVLLVILGLLGYLLLHQDKAALKQVLIKKDTVTQTAVSSTQPFEGPLESSIFVPYWSVDAELAESEYDRVIYFGVTANKNGVDRSEAGYLNLDSFVKAAGNKEKYLTLRLLNSDFNLELLSDTELQKDIITEVVSLAQEKGFTGVVLDLELSVIPVADLSPQINTFVSNLYSETQAADIRLAVAVYGDVFYRKRPFDLQHIGEHSDEVMIMAYDFSKSYGEPGPNFPLNGRDEYNYSFEQMLEDFTSAVPADKLIIIFGMYGYDWTLGDQGKPLKQASAVTLSQAKARFINTCRYETCGVTVDSLVGETKVNYTDNEGYEHTVWLETEQSVEAKTELLRNAGIGKISYWAYGYF